MLTLPHRLYLSNPHNATRPAWDLVRAFMRTFKLDANTAAELIGQWIRETH